ncbi:AP-2 complex subunit beta [Orchesella cincta]|uniref:AP complex subunit beta n=1 Tax=Orchesella cincta TaxID=48709 RepID=A0A1D2MAL5_ORCCI|nr:AP-2 complex subunit beta [Orchesella cincta]
MLPHAVSFSILKTGDAKYFTTTKKGEVFELKAELNSDKKERRRDAVKKVIAAMTVGKDVSALFPDVLNCMQTDNLELKKLVYLYLMNYAKSQPDLAIMAINTFVKDSGDANPLIRALAIRTMGCIRVDKISEYLCDPLRNCLKDNDPYVKKTAAVCVAKLYDINPQLVEDQGFLDELKELLSDSNQMVVANAVAALSEITDSSPSGTPLVWMDSTAINKLLIALNECAEWGQIFILDSVANYTPQHELEAQSICERIIPRLAHANAAVKLSTVKVLMKYMEIITDAEFVNMLTRKLTPPLVTLLASEPELQYVALRNINLIVQKRPEILKREVKAFFVNYNDPIYIKLEKLDIMIRLTSKENIGQVLSELKEYGSEVDVDFVRKSVRAIGRCAIKVEEFSERCVTTLLELIQTKVNYVVQEAVVVIKDVFRKYPNKYEGIIGILCECLDTLDEPEARASMIWIIGEYAERIDNAGDLLEGFLHGFADENIQVQLQLLTAIVKLFLKRPSESQELVQQVLSLATQTDNPDLRDRGFIYWRLLSADPAAAKEVVLSEKPLILDEMDLLEPSLLDELLCHISSLASVYHKPPSAFMDEVSGQRKALPIGFQFSEETSSLDAQSIDSSEECPVVEVEDLLGVDMAPTGFEYGPIGQSATSGESSVDLLSSSLDELGLGNPFLCALSAIPAPYSSPKALWLPAAKGKGLEIYGTFVRKNQEIYMEMTLTNQSTDALSDFAIQFNKNSFGVIPALPLQVPSPLPPNGSCEVSLLLSTTGSIQKTNPLNNLQVAIKNSVGVLYFTCLIPMHVFFTGDGQMDRRVFLSTWKELPAQHEVQYTLENMALNPDIVVQKMKQNNVFTIARQHVEDHDVLYQSIKLTNNLWILVEIRIPLGESFPTVSWLIFFVGALSMNRILS